MTVKKTTAALGAVFALALTLTACGTSVPGNSVADVAGNPITMQAFNHWMYVAAKGSSQGSSAVIVPNDPPSFANCISDARKSIPAVAKQSDAELRSECSQLFTTLSSNVMQFLIQSYWYQAQAYQANIKVTDAEVQKEFSSEKNQQFPTEAEFQQFLTESGETLNDVLYRVKINLILQKLLKLHTTSVTPAQIEAYYNSHTSSYGKPESLDMRIIVAKSVADANAAKKALASGESWTTVAKKYSIDPTTKDTGGVLNGVTKGQQDAALDAAAFSAPQGKLQGPVKSQLASGYYVFEVTKITPATQQTLAQATPTIRSLLTTQAQNDAQNAVDDQVKSKWQSKTTCRQNYSINLCSGYKASSSSSSATTS